jgi:plastocyanin
VRLWITLAVVIALGSGCRSKTDQPGSPTPPATTLTTPPVTTPPTTPPTTSSLQCTDQSKMGQFTLVIKGTAFHPDCLIVKGTQSSEVANKDSIQHNWTVTGTQINVDIGPHQTSRFEATGLSPGIYRFFCRFHRSLGMVGTLVVK